MLISVLLALVIYWLSNTFTLVAGHPYVNFAIFAIIIFLLFGYFAVRPAGQIVPGEPQPRRWYLF